MSAREYCTVVPDDGYVHKFRLEAREEARAQVLEPALPAHTVSLGALLGKLGLVALALIALGAAGARVLI